MGKRNNSFYIVFKLCILLDSYFQSNTRVSTFTNFVLVITYYLQSLCVFIVGRSLNRSITIMDCQVRCIKIFEISEARHHF